jgi:Mrp family chromosome partitioning ATPase
MLTNDETVKNAAEAASEEGAKTRIKETIAVMSGKGGVGKSALTILLAASLRRKG